MGKQYRVRVKGLDAEGRGIVEFNNRKFALRGVLPGELVTMELVYHAKETGAKLCEVIEPSKERVVPSCDKFGVCGGCQLLHMSVKAQKSFKQQICEDYLGAFGKVSEILTAEQPEYYRNKVHAAFSSVPAGKGRRRIVAGIFEENSHRVVPTKQCRIEEKNAAKYIETVCQLMEKTKTAPYNEDCGTGVMRYVFLRFAKETGQVLMALVTGSEEFPARAVFIAEIRKRHPEITTLVQNVNPQKNSMVLGKKETVLFGNGTIEDVLCGCRFRISAASFYQVNPQQTVVLYNTAVQMAELTAKTRVLDAYCGIGTISLLAAKSAKSVVGVELNKKAVTDAIANASLNRQKNVEFVCADAGEYMVAAAARKDAPDVVFMDPPRSGSDEKFLSSLVKASPEKVVYISCNPQTQARDLTFLTAHGYRVSKIQPVDMFPGTVHVETVCLLSKLHEAKHHVSVTLDMDEMDLTSAESKATYEEIKKYVAEHNDGMKVSNLYIAQVKRKCGLELAENFNLPKSEDSRQPQCPKEKEEAIMEALKAFQMI